MTGKRACVFKNSSFISYLTQLFHESELNQGIQVSRLTDPIYRMCHNLELSRTSEDEEWERFEVSEFTQPFIQRF